MLFPYWPLLPFGRGGRKKLFLSYSPYWRTLSSYSAAVSVGSQTLLPDHHSSPMEQRTRQPLLKESSGARVRSGG